MNLVGMNFDHFRKRQKKGIRHGNVTRLGL
jgi:hypothetical protein